MPLVHSDWLAPVRSVWCMVGLAALLLVLGACTPVWAHPADASSDSARTVSAPVRYTAERFTVSDGLPQNSVQAIAQTPDRYLWIGTRDGLARFDGASFTTFTPSTTPALPSSHITALASGPDGTLWIGTAAGLARYRNGTFESLADQHSAWATYIRELTVADDGTVWTTPEHMLLRHRADTTTALRPRDWPGLRPRLIKNLHVDTQDRLWLLYDDMLQTQRADSMHTLRRGRALPDDNLVAIGDGPDGAVQVGTESGQRVLVYADSVVTRPHLLPEEASADAYAFSREPDAFTWVGRSDVLTAYRNADSVFTYAPDPAHTYPPNVFYRDQAGTMWVGTEGGGLLRLNQPLFTVYDVTDGLSYNVALSLTEGPDDDMWIGTNCRGLNQWADGQMTSYVDDNVPPDACLYAATTRHDSTVWVGHNDVVRINPDTGASTRIPLPYDASGQPKRGDVVKALYEDPSDPEVLWVGTIYGLYKLRGTEVQARYTTADGLPANRVQYIHRSERTGALWLSTRQGLARLHDNEITALTPETGFPSRSPRAIYEDPQGALWIGTYGDGLVHYADDTFTALTESDGLFDNVVSALVPDGNGALWMSGNRGIARARLDDLYAVVQNRRTRLPTVDYGQAAGLLNPETNGGFQPAAATDAQGRLWFPTLGGVAVVDPNEAVAAAQPPPVDVQGVSYQREPLSLSGPENELPLGQRSFDIQYTGINLSRADAVRFQYQLQGVDASWQPAGGRRTAFYTNVPPGTHTFRVRAANEDGEWSAPATLTLTVPPHFYETTWFMGLVGLVVVMGLVGAYQMRTYRLRNRKAELQRQVRAQTAALRAEKQRTAEALDTVAEQKEAISALNAAKSRLFANVSHEFRTPLTVALGLLEDWIDADDADLADSLRADLEQVLLQNRRVLRLVNQLLDIARLESQSLTLRVQPVALAPFLQRVAAAFEPLAAQQGITFNRRLPGDIGSVPADPEHLETVVVNLLSNAFKFTPAEGTITLTATVHDERDETACIQVADTGPGIPPEDHDAIFERFVQTHRSDAGGTGIGLALVKALTEQHGGTVSVESAEDDGTTFTIAWPRHVGALPDEAVVVDETADGTGDGLPRPNAAALPQITSPAEAATDADAKDDASHPTVLIVDDNADIRAYVRRHLAARYHIIEADDGQAGLEQARRHTPDCIVSDVMMPRVDGVAMLRALRDDPATDFIPVVLLTARAELDDKIGGLDAGADDYLTKPFRPRELRARIRTLLAQRMRLRERFQADPPAAPASPNDTPPVVQEVQAVIHEHLADPELSVKDLVDALPMSRSTLYRRLRKATEHSPSDLIWQVRLTEAHRLLAQGEGNVSEVAYGVGFKTVSHFSSRFQDHFGVPPSTIRPSVSQDA
ncbi:MAG: two-component regulator propeller domain-containing protein [Longimonas sp.]|uniref:hybrid sensor histidine kinase/response regulator transcription factor n=1 Tax=Longimonas sp. TaxID=2039626 RepID=UPI0039757396